MQPPRSATPAPQSPTSLDSRPRPHCRRRRHALLRPAPPTRSTTTGSATTGSTTTGPTRSSPATTWSAATRTPASKEIPDRSPRLLFLSSLGRHIRFQPLHLLQRQHPLQPLRRLIHIRPRCHQLLTLLKHIPQSPPVPAVSHRLHLLVQLRKIRRMVLPPLPLRCFHLVPYRLDLLLLLFAEIKTRPKARLTQQRNQLPKTIPHLRKHPAPARPHPAPASESTPPTPPLWPRILHLHTIRHTALRCPTPKVNPHRQQQPRHNRTANDDPRSHSKLPSAKMPPPIPRNHLFIRPPPRFIAPETQIQPSPLPTSALQSPIGQQ